MNRVIIPLATLLLLLGCGDQDVGDVGRDAAVSKPAPETGAGPGPKQATTVKPQGPVKIVYKIIGTPIVGQPVAIELQVESMLGPQEVDLSYRITDATALQFSDAQPSTVRLAATRGEVPAMQQVRVIPMREGRLFLNVSASVKTESGKVSTVTAIPIPVGANSRREVQDHGVVTTDESGDAIKVLKGDQPDP